MRTTEFFIYRATGTAIILTALLAGASKHSGVDPFGAFQASHLTTCAAFGCLIARELANSGTRYGQQG